MYGSTANNYNTCYPFLLPAHSFCQPCYNHVQGAIVQIDHTWFTYAVQRQILDII